MKWKKRELTKDLEFIFFIYKKYTIILHAHNSAMSMQQC